METMVFNSVEQATQAYNTGDRKKDLEVVNAVLAGNVQIKPPEELKPVETVQSTPTTEPIVTPVEPNNSIDEIEQARKYSEFIEQKAKEDHLQHLAEIKAKEDEINREKTAREELEKQLQRLSEIKDKQPLTSMSTSEDIKDEELYANEYDKRTREMVEELKRQVGDHPVIKELAESVSAIKKEYEDSKNNLTKIQREKEKQDQEDKFFDSIQKFQLDHPELQTQKNIREIDREYTTFRKNIAYLVKAKSSYEVEKAIEDYNKGGKTKELADANGIKSVSDFTTYNLIADLMDMKNGIQRNPITGEYNPVLDEEGKQVRYRSLDDVYKIKHFSDEINNARKQSFKEIGQKLETFANAPVTLSNEQTDNFSTGYSAAEEKDILNWDPRTWINNPERRKKVEEVYAKRGLPMPQYRNRK